MSSKTKDKEKYLLQVNKKIEIAIGDRKATIAIAIVDLFSNGDRDRDRDLKFHEDRDRDRDHNFRDRVNTLAICCMKSIH